MKATGTNIPECWGIYGVHQSGDVVDVPGSRDEVYKGDDVSMTTNRTSASRFRPLGCEQGGVKIYRPLLSFSKARIRHTCQAYSLDWAEDATNHDVTRTIRNAIRSLLTTQRLPRALSKDRLLSLYLHADRKTKDIHHRGYELFKHTDFLAFDMRSGCLAVRLPQPLDDNLGLIDLLRRIFQLVSPQERISISDIDTALDYMFREASRTRGKSKGQKSSHLKFSTCGVVAARRDMPFETASNEAVSSGLDPNFIWVLSREPVRRFKEPECILMPAINYETPSKPRNNMEHSYLTAQIENDSYYWSAWDLWDGRFWIRVSNRTGQPLKIRMFSKCDWSALKPSLPSEVLKSLRQMMAAAAPGAARYTLPVIATASHPERVLAFPTLPLKWSNLSDVLDWEVRYKAVDFEPRGIDGRKGEHDISGAMK
ncbi:MAG: hypothetical protein Q9195_001439 [Heterodermia aff. obscurata]